MTELWLVPLIFVGAVAFDWALHEQFSLLRQIVPPRRPAMPYLPIGRSNILMWIGATATIPYLFAKSTGELNAVSWSAFALGALYVGYVAWTIMRE